MQEQLTKKCTVCGQEKWLTEFHRHPRGRLGLKPSCKSCCQARYLANRTLSSRPKRRATIDRFLEKFEIAENGCWEWTASLNNMGYGQLNPGGRSSPILAHRFAYEYAVGPIPEDLELDHLCGNSRCVHPDHLEPVTHQENLRRSRRWRR